MKICCALRILITHDKFCTCFPRTEAWLNEHTHHQELIYQLVCDEVTDIEFRSMMDGLYCLVFPTGKAECQAYYDSEGPQLIHLHPARLIEAYDEWLLQFCASCMEQLA